MSGMVVGWMGEETRFQLVNIKHNDTNKEDINLNLAQEDCILTFEPQARITTLPGAGVSKFNGEGLQNKINSLTVSLTGRASDSY